MQFNKKLFVEEILNVDFKGNVSKCAVAMEITPGYFSKMIFTPTMKGGLKLLGGVVRYCKQTGRDPERYLC